MSSEMVKFGPQSYGEPELEDDELVEAPKRADRTIKADWVDWEIPEGVEVDQFDPVAAGQKSLFDLTGEP